MRWAVLSDQGRFRQLKALLAKLDGLPFAWWLAGSASGVVGRAGLQGFDADGADVRCSVQSGVGL